MKKIHSLLALLLLSLLSACNDQIEMPYSGVDDDVPEGMVRMHIAPNVIDQSVVVTRATQKPAGAAETTIGNCRVLVFDKGPGQLDKALLTQVPASAAWNTTDQRLDVLLYEEPSVQRFILVVANLSVVGKNWLDSQDAGVSYTTIQQNLINTLPTSGNVRIEPAALPMSGWMAASVEIKKTSSTTVLNPALNPVVTLTRSVARIDIDATATTAIGEEFLITGAGVANCPRNGNHLPDMSGKLTAWNVTQVAACNLQTQTGKNTLTEMVYAYEHDGAIGSSAEYPLRIVVRGIRAGTLTESYYGIDIFYEATPGDPKTKSMEIRRNNIYTIKLNKVRQDGYATFEEAARASSFNTALDADISVTDPYAHDIVTNGRQYLGVTNTEYVLYPFKSDTLCTNLAVASFTYTCDPSWMAGQIILPTGITLPAGTSRTLAVSSYTVQRDLVVDIDPTFKEGVIILHIGNLKKEIKVRRKIATTAIGGVYSDYYAGAPDVDPDTQPTFKEFKIGEIINFSPSTSWLQVATTPYVNGEAALSNRIVTGAGGIYIHVANNFSYDNAIAHDREASIYLAGDTQGERLRVHVQQLTRDVYRGILKLEPFAYVGAFWRHNQTAERIIRMSAKPKPQPSFWWQANVVVGMEWIVMDTDRPGTTPNGETVNHYIGGGTSGTPNPYGEGDENNTQFGSDIEASKSCQVNSKLRTVSGKSDYIYFRIGLTSKLASASVTPRYGLIMISYGTTVGEVEGYHPIYIRQGEAADYLMRPFDPITRDPKLGNNQQYPSRPNAVRISPFNLDAPDNIIADPHSNTYKGYYELKAKTATFTSYPTWAGSYFQGTRSLSTGLINAFPACTTTVPPRAVNYGTTWNPADESCPRGYRRIQDGDITTQNTAGLIIGSEIRQSLLLFPVQGGDWTLPPNTQTSLSNQYRGYLADGYFDRLKITESNNAAGSNRNVPYSIVNQSKVGQAHIGALFFNPYNYASIFLPFTGRWGGATGISADFLSRGSNTSFVTSTPSLADTSTAMWYLWVGNGFDSNNKDFTSMYPSSSPGIPSSIRCVRDDNPIIESGGEIGNPGSGTTVDGIHREDNPDDNSNISALLYYTGTGTLQSQIMLKYSDVKRKQIGSIAISGDKQLSSADYDYLNAWANDNTFSLRHISIQGHSTLNVNIPINAFTSPRWITIALGSHISTIADGAFAATLTPGLKTLMIAHLDNVTANAGAFLFTTSEVSLRLNGNEYGYADKTAKIWKGRTWAGIRLNN